VRGEAPQSSKLLREFFGSFARETNSTQLPFKGLKHQKLAFSLLVHVESEGTSVACKL
jgi:hypothetical protein